MSTSQFVERACVIGLHKCARGVWKLLNVRANSKDQLVEQHAIGLVTVDAISGAISDSPAGPPQ
jgi:hypothetical protein